MAEPNSIYVSRPVKAMREPMTHMIKEVPTEPERFKMVDAVEKTPAPMIRLVTRKIDEMIPICFLFWSMFTTAASFSVSCSELISFEFLTREPSSASFLKKSGI